jgi:hypothetical protein
MKNSVRFLLEGIISSGPIGEITFPVAGSGDSSEGISLIDKANIN